jgi:hypothetical protein
VPVVEGVTEGVPELDGLLLPVPELDGVPVAKAVRLLDEVLEAVVEGEAVCTPATAL